MKKIIFLVLVLILLLGCAPTEKQCTRDNDCVPASCCHASKTVNKLHAPDCEGILCSMECVPETTDCGQGEIKCVEGKCEVVLN